tara:strand:+ start:24 stop:320 length:297 start_codon:yes stop_codon:yes gene_type:complete
MTWINDKKWQKESDEWIKMTDKNREMKEKRNKNKQIQGYKVEIIFTQPLNAPDPFDWISEAMDEGNFKYKTEAVHATSVEPIDIESDEYKWLRDASTS